MGERDPASAVGLGGFAAVGQGAKWSATMGGLTGQAGSAREPIEMVAQLSAIAEAPKASASAAPAKSGKVVFLVSHSSAGGAQEIWVNLADGMRERGHTVTLAALYPDERSLRSTPRELPWVYAAPSRPKSLLSYIKMTQELVQLFRTLKPDIVYSALPAANVLAPLAARLSGCDCTIVTSHHTPINTYSRWLNLIDNMTGTMREVRAIITVSDAVGRSMGGKPKQYRAKRRTIHNALPPAIESHLRLLGGQKVRHEATRRSIVATGRLAQQKNYPALVRAAAHLKDAQVHIVGGGPDERALKAYAEALGVSDYVTFHGFVPRKRALELLAAGDIFVQPSLFEGHSLALVEAAKLGLPLVVSNIPVQIEGITAWDGARCGIAINAGNELEFAGQLQRLLDDPDYYRQHAELAKKLAQGVTYSTMIEAYEALMP